MTHQETLQHIHLLLPKLPPKHLSEVLAMLQGWLETDDMQKNPARDDDAFESRLRADVTAGYFDALIAEVIAEDDAGKTRDLCISK